MKPVKKKTRKKHQQQINKYGQNLYDNDVNLTFSDDFLVYTKLKTIFFFLTKN